MCFLVQLQVRTVFPELGCGPEPVSQTVNQSVTSLERLTYLLIYLCGLGAVSLLLMEFVPFIIS